MYVNKLKLNNGKTEFMLLGRSHDLQNVTLDSMHVGDVTVCKKDFVKNLGVMFDTNMKMDVHVENICRVSYYHLKNISDIRKYLSKDSAQKLVHAFVTSRLDYCNSLLYGTSSILLSKLQWVQNMAARIVALKGKYEHITPVLKDLHWLPIRYRIIYKLLLITYKALNNQAPVYIKDFIQMYESKRSNLRSSGQSLLHVPKSNFVRCGDRAFAVCAPTLWNKLPLEIKCSATIDTFKSNLKTHLFKQAF